MSDINKTSISLYDLLICITNAGDLVRPELEEHHQRVAYIAYQIADHMGMSIAEKKDLVLAGLLHDIGTLTLHERLELLENEPRIVHDHALRGARLIERFQPLSDAAGTILHHHVPWNYGAGSTFMGETVRMESHILHLADRVAVMVRKDRDILEQVGSITQSIQDRRDSVFVPELVDVFTRMSQEEYIWLDIAFSPLLYMLPQIILFETMDLNMDEVMELTKMFSRIIDFRSPFTSYHSAGVSATAQKLAEIAGFCVAECKMMAVAGNLHDLGKLAVRREVLEKQDKLNAHEFNEIRSHTFYTYRLLQAIRGFETISMWASFHHEKLNGKGYPFHLRDHNIPLGSRIVAVADVFTAITEDRPYRRGMSVQEAVAILHSMVADGSLCPYVVSLLTANLAALNAVRLEAQENARVDYERIVHDLSAARV